MDIEQDGGFGFGKLKRGASTLGRGVKQGVLHPMQSARSLKEGIKSKLPGGGFMDKLKKYKALLAIMAFLIPVLTLFGLKKYSNLLGFKNMEPFQTTPQQRGPQKVADNPDMAYLTNLQLMTTRVPPPLQTNNRESPETAKTAIQGYISDCLNTGSRTFFLDVDFNVKMDSTPMLIYRKGNDAVANNYCQIGDVMSQLQTVGFSNGVQNNKMPIIVILNVVRTPITDPIRNLREYNKYLDHIANALKPYESSMLAQTPIGDFRYHQKEQDLISTPITNPNFIKKFIILCNANVSLYGADEIGNTHLNHYVHLRYFLDDPNQQTVGVSLPPIMTDPPKAVVATAASLVNMNSASQQSWVAGHSSVFTIAVPMMSSTVVDATMLPILQMGVNCVPTYIADKNPTSYWGVGTPWVIVPPAHQNQIS